MKKIAAAVLGLSLGVAGMAVQAESTYWGVGVSQNEMNSQYFDLDLSADVQGLEAVVGIETSPYIAWELRLGFGLGDDDIVVSYGGESESTGINFQVDSYVSGYFRPQYVTQNFQIYGLLGFSNINANLSSNGYSEDDSSSGISYGVGAGYIFSEQFSVNIEWKKIGDIKGLDDGDGENILDGDVSGITLNFQRKF